MIRSPIKSAIKTPIGSAFEFRSYVPPAIPTGNWLLISGIWEDPGQWDDAATWND